LTNIFSDGLKPPSRIIAGTWLKISLEAPEDLNVWIRNVACGFWIPVGTGFRRKKAAFKRQADLYTLDGAVILHLLGCIKPWK